MSGLVLELQSNALDKLIPVSDLMRKALVVSKKLGVTTIERWLSHELNGYPSTIDTPHTVRSTAQFESGIHVTAGNR